MSKTIIESYLEGLQASLKNIDNVKIEKFADIIFEAYQKDKQIFILGNGGSASTASHFMCDLVKNSVIADKPRLRVVCLNDNIALMTAYSNDVSFECIFEEQLHNFLNEGDIVLSITGSGNSANVIKSIEFARQRKAKTLAFLGFNGGKAKALVDEYILIENNDYGQIEDIHLSLAHIISYCLKEKIKNSNTSERKSYV